MTQQALAPVQFYRGDEPDHPLRSLLDARKKKQFVQKQEKEPQHDVSPDIHEEKQMGFVDLIEQNDAVGFQALLEQRLSEKVGTILREAQAYIATQMFAENMHAEHDHDPQCAGCDHCEGEQEPHLGPHETSEPQLQAEPGL